MELDPDTAGERPAWFVGAAFGGNDDQTDRFIDQGVWENGYQDQYLETVKSIQVGDRIAIKATGRVTKNPGDGRHLEVDWIPVEPRREWYFYTHPRAVWKVLPRSLRACAG